MRKFLVLAFFSVFCLSFSTSLYAKKDLVSPFRSSVPGLQIYNSHFIDNEGGFLIRGMRPRSDDDVKQLKQIGVTDILIFRDSPKEESSAWEEFELLEKNGISSSRARVIPFKWKNIEDFEAACEQTIDALQMMREIDHAKDRGLFFHCTVGEDRTGYLSALYRILYQNWNSEQAWKKEMCENGYADGNPIKPLWVSEEIHKGVSVLFSHMTALIEQKKLAPDRLYKSACRELKSSMTQKVAFGTCERSAKYDPKIR